MEVTQTKKEPLISFPEKFKPELAFGLYLFASGYAFNCFGLWIKLGFNHKPLDTDYRGWFISLSNNYLMLNWGTKNISMWTPWDYVLVKADVLTIDQNWGAMKKQDLPHFSKLMDHGRFKDERAMFKAPFNYLTRSNTVQTTECCFYVTRGFFKWRVLTRASFGKVKTGIHLNITFKNPVGEGVGSWRGGLRKAVFEMTDKDSNPFAALTRMQLEKRGQL